jgi:hypothetical protein
LKAGGAGCRIGIYSRPVRRYHGAKERVGLLELRPVHERQSEQALCLQDV